MAIISLSSIPPRFPYLGEVFASLLQQSAQIAEIRLYVPRAYKRFPDWDGTPPEVPAPVRLIRVDEDFGPATKILHAARDLHGTGQPILFCDDDRVYRRSWAEGLLQAHAAKPDCCIAVSGWHMHKILKRPEPFALPGPRASFDMPVRDALFRYGTQLWRWQRRLLKTGLRPPLQTNVAVAGHVEILRGYAGVLVLPEFFDAPCFDIPEDIWMVDDIWISGHMARQGIPVWVLEGQKICALAQSEEIEALHASVFGGANRQASNRRAAQYFQETYGVWTDAAPPLL